MAARNPLAGPLDGAAILFIAAYLGAVLWQGNISKFGSAVMADGTGFLEFAIALYIVFWLTSQKGNVGDISKALVGLAIVGLIVTKLTGYRADAFAAFGSGQIGLFALVAKLFGAN